MKNNNYLVLLLAILCFTVLPSFTILDEDKYTTDIEVNLELEEFVTELKAELNRITTELLYQLKIEETLAKINLVNPNGAIFAYSMSGCGGNPASTTFGWLNQQENIDVLCQTGSAGSASYMYQDGMPNCIPISCSL